MICHCSELRDGIDLCGVVIPINIVIDNDTTWRPYTCTEPIGHEGNHVACGRNIHEIAVWSKENKVSLEDQLTKNTNLRWLTINNIHHWLHKNYGRANKCENIDCDKSSKKYEWALKNDVNYDYVRENYWMLCLNCHRKYDNNGRTHSLRSRIKISKDRILRGLGVKNRYAIKPVIQMTREGSEVKKWECGRDASIELGIPSQHISECCHGRMKTCGGFTWKFAVQD